MLKKKITSLLLAFAMVFSLSACLDDEFDEEDDITSKQAIAEETKGNGTNNATDPTNQNAGGNITTDFTVSKSSVSLKVDSNSGAMSVERVALANALEAEADTWTIFVYICGADLESDGGMATADIEEMMDASTGSKVRFVLLTGGASKWENKMVDAKKLQTYVVQNGELKKISETKGKNMGDPTVLSDFLITNIKAYAAERMGLIFWDHGSGSINGVCFDELYDNDSLSLTEIDAALLKTRNATGSSFEFIGFDACLMGTVETANIMASYARYMYGSEETEPGYGWDYTAIGNYLGKNPGATGLDLGKVVTDSFLEMCEEIGEEASATFSVYDLTKLDDFLTAYNRYYYDVYTACKSNSGLLTDVARAIMKADNFGGNNKSEGYTNMVDLMDAIVNIGTVADSVAVKNALKNLVVYNKNGKRHSKSQGLATYYPLSIEGSSEMKIFSGLCVSPYYLSLIDMLQQQSNNNVSFSDYTNTGIFSNGSFWNNIFEYDIDDEDYEPDYDEEDDYFDYLSGDDEESNEGDSPFITFEQEPAIDEDGNFFFILDEDGYYNMYDIYANVYMQIDDDIIEMGQTYDLNVIDDYTYSDYFDGYWISLPDGQNLALYYLGTSDDYIFYTSPILLNGEEVYLHISQDFEEGNVYIDGIWAGLDDNGSASRTVYELSDGDEIIPIFYIYGDDDYYVGGEYTYHSGDELYYDVMDEGDYYYTFIIEDIYGGYYESGYAQFYVEADGNVSFYVE